LENPANRLSAESLDHLEDMKVKLKGRLERYRESFVSNEEQEIVTLAQSAAGKAMSALDALGFGDDVAYEPIWRRIHEVLMEKFGMSFGFELGQESARLQSEMTEAASPPSLPADMSTEGAPTEESISDNLSSRWPDPFGRRKAVDEYIREVRKITGKQITRTDFWKAACYKDRSTFERWQKGHPKSTATADINFQRILTQKPHLRT